MLGIEGHDRLADRPLDPETPVTARDGDLDASSLAAGFFDRRTDASFQPRDGAAIPSANGLDEQAAE